MVFYKQRKVAREWLHVLMDGSDIGPFLKDEFDKGEVYYSITTPQMTFCMKVKNCAAIQKQVNLVQQKYGLYIYHIIVTPNMYAMMYVPKEGTSKDFEKVEESIFRVPAVVYNTEYDIVEFGDIFVASTSDGLLRIW